MPRPRLLRVGTLAPEASTESRCKERGARSRFGSDAVGPNARCGRGCQVVATSSGRRDATRSMALLFKESMIGRSGGAGACGTLGGGEGPIAASAGGGRGAADDSEDVGAQQTAARPLLSLGTRARGANGAKPPRALPQRLPHRPESKDLAVRLSEPDLAVVCWLQMVAAPPPLLLLLRPDGTLPGAGVAAGRPRAVGSAGHATFGAGAGGGRAGEDLAGTGETAGSCKACSRSSSNSLDIPAFTGGGSFRCFKTPMRHCAVSDIWACSAGFWAPPSSRTRSSYFSSSCALSPSSSASRPSSSSSSSLSSSLSCSSSDSSNSLAPTRGSCSMHSCSASTSSDTLVGPSTAFARLPSDSSSSSDSSASSSSSPSPS
mmetsp:Transcript_51286/g.143402  ORF Transcript_51286/g.143402 Transcript_51286/m.143402 type:complete len:375 (+) Transcript_51286:669-1793(+)